MSLRDYLTEGKFKPITWVDNKGGYELGYLVSFSADKKEAIVKFSRGKTTTVKTSDLAWGHVEDFKNEPRYMQINRIKK